MTFDDMIRALSARPSRYAGIYTIPHLSRAQIADRLVELNDPKIHLGRGVLMEYEVDEGTALIGGVVRSDDVIEEGWVLLWKKRRD